MKSNRRLKSLLTACCMTLCLTTAVMADPSVYDATLISGQGFSVAEDGVTVMTKIYPGDRIANTEVYLGMDNLNAGMAENLSGMLDDGTPCWINQTGRVYSVLSLPVDTGVQQMDAEGNLLFDEAGNPVNVTDTKYVLETSGGIVETAFGSSGTDASDPYTGGSLKDTSYSLRGDQAYFYTDDTGMPQTIYASDIDAAAYPNGTSVYLTYNPSSDPTLVFTGWSVYKVQPDGSMARVPDDQIAQLGIPELAGPGQLGAEAVNAAGGRLYITVNGMSDHLVFVPVFGAAPQSAENPEAVDPAVDPNAVDPAVDPDAVIPAADPYAAAPAEDPALISELAADAGAPDVISLGSDTDGLNTELNADGIISDEAQPAQPAYTYEIFVNYVDPEWNGESTGYYIYTGGEFAEAISTAQNDPNGLVFSKWTSDSDAVTIDGEDSVQATIKIDPSVAVTENKVINITAVYAEPQPVKAVSELTLVDAAADADLDLTQVEEGTVLTVLAAQKSGLVFTGWTADGIELDEDQLSASSVTITMPANAVTLIAQYRMETEAPAEMPADVTADVPSEVQTDTPVEMQTDAPAEIQTDAPAEIQTETPAEMQTDAPAGIQTETLVEIQPETPADQQAQSDAPNPEETVVQEEVLTAQNASIENDSTVVNEDGTVSVTVARGETVTVVSDEAPEGQRFEKWNVTSDGAVETSDITEKILEVKVNEDVNVEPVFIAAEGDSTQPGDQNSDGQGGENQQPESQQPESQQPESQQPESQQPESQQPESQQPESQQPESQQSEESAQPDTDGPLEPQSEPPAPVYTLTVVSGSADITSLKEGQTASLNANAPSKGYVFSSWTVSGSGSVASQTSAQTTFTMGAANSTVTANYSPATYNLTVKNGSGSGSYKYGAAVDITANYPETGKEFDCWVVQSGGAVLDDSSSYYGSLSMPASDASVKATYVNGPDPANNSITGLENGKEYLKGSTLTFTAAGAGMDKAGKNPGDYRYKPSGYQIGGVNGSWSSSPYTTSMAINAAGDYTLTVTYAKEVYDGSNWYTDGTTVTKSVTFHIVTAMSVNTGDSTPLGLFIAAGAAALAVIIALIVILIRRKNR